MTVGSPSALRTTGSFPAFTWRASRLAAVCRSSNEADVRDELTKDIQRHGERSQFIQIGGDEFALRAWLAE